MAASDLTQLLYSFIVLSIFLLIGTFLRAVVPFFQKVFLPASVIGGFLAMLLGPTVLKLLPFPDTWMTTWSNMPGILIVPVVASVPLGMKFGGSNGTKVGKAGLDAFKMFCVLVLASAVQYLVNVGTGIVFRSSYGLYDAFGLELCGGYSGGHGTAGVIGKMMGDMGLPYWEVAQGITTTTATVGLISGMVLGIIYINIMARRGKTALLKKPSEIPADLAKGIQMDVAKQVSLGRETTYNSSIESLTFHLSIILTGCGIAYVMMNFVKAHKIPIITQIPIWAYAIVVMFGVNYVIQIIGLGTLLDSKSKSRLNGALSDYAITAAIASIPLKAVLPYLVPIVVMCAIGLVVTAIVIIFCCNKFFDDCCVERSVAIWGSATGVFLNGLMLLKIADHDYELPVLNDYSVGFSFTSIIGFILMPIIINTLLTPNGSISVIIMQLVIGAVLFLGLFIANRLTKGAAARERANV